MTDQVTEPTNGNGSKTLRQVLYESWAWMPGTRQGMRESLRALSNGMEMPPAARDRLVRALERYSREPVTPENLQRLVADVLKAKGAAQRCVVYWQADTAAVGS
jgi:hypothetical protein